MSYYPDTGLNSGLPPPPPPPNHQYTQAAPNTAPQYYDEYQRGRGGSRPTSPYSVPNVQMQPQHQQYTHPHSTPYNQAPPSGHQAPSSGYHTGPPDGYSPSSHQYSGYHPPPPGHFPQSMKQQQQQSQYAPPPPPPPGVDYREERRERIRPTPSPMLNTLPQYDTRPLPSTSHYEAPHPVPTPPPPRIVDRQYAAGPRDPHPHHHPLSHPQHGAFPSAFNKVPPHIIRPEPVYGDPRMEIREDGRRKREGRMNGDGRGGRMDDNLGSRGEVYRENPMFDPPSNGCSRGEINQWISPEDEAERLYRLSLLDRTDDRVNTGRGKKGGRHYDSSPDAIESASPFSSASPSPPLRVSHSPPPSSRRRSSSPDYWAIANEAERGSVKWLRLLILSVLNQWSTVEYVEKNEKLVTIEYLSKLLRSYDQGKESDKQSDCNDAIAPVLGFKHEVSWLNFLRSMRDDGLLRIYELDVVANKRYFAIYAPDDTHASFVKRKPYLD